MSTQREISRHTNETPSYDESRGDHTPPKRKDCLWILVLVLAIAGVVLFSGISLLPGEVDEDPVEPSGASADREINTDTPEVQDTIDTPEIPYPEYRYEGPADIEGLPSSINIEPFTLAKAFAAPKLSEEHVAAIEDALYAYLDHNVPVGFFLMDMQTGRGLAYNLDASIYGASSIKGAYCGYLLQRYIETGTYTLSTSIGSGYLDEEDGMCKAGGYEPIRSLIESTILYSSNDAYASLRNNFSDEAFVNWLAEMSVGSHVAYDTWFPRYSTRDAVQMWMNLYSYLNYETETGLWFKSLLSATQVSFIRPSLDAVDGVVVYGKAGWCADASGGSRYSGMCETAIVSLEGTDYLLIIMTGAAHSDSNMTLMGNLAAAIFDAREDLS